MEGKHIDLVKLKLLVTIKDYGGDKELTDLYLENHIPFHVSTHGHGTASSEILDYLGLGSNKKNIIISTISEYQVNHVFSLLKTKMHFDKPGRGVAFTIPVTSISCIMQHLDEIQINEKLAKYDCEVNQVKQDKRHELIITIMNQGYSDDAMNAAKVAGATGGTLVHAKGLGSAEAAKFLGITIQPEKDIVLIITEHDNKSAIMESINKAVGLHTPGKGIMFAIPVDETVGLE